MNPHILYRTGFMHPESAIEINLNLKKEKKERTLLIYC